MTTPAPMPNHPFAKLQADPIQPLKAHGRFDKSVHQWSQAEIDALALALAARRPLLVRGEPGTGKTQLARAAAEHLGWMLHTTVIHARFEPHDLLYRFDAVRRLADAQAGKGGGAAISDKEASYWEPGPLWQAFDWHGAQGYGPRAGRQPEPAPKGHVILIDEIDKADSDLPNSLLEVLGQRSFEIPALGLSLGGPQVATPPLIIITTNEDRELPAPFVRRCMVLNLLPDADYVAWLVKRGQAHFGMPSGEPGGKAAAKAATKTTAKATTAKTSAKGSPGKAAPPRVSPEVITAAAQQLAQDRQQAEAHGHYRPGLAEYLDLLGAIEQLAPGDHAAQKAWFQRASRYAFAKHAQYAGPGGTLQPGMGLEPEGEGLAATQGDGASAPRHASAKARARGATRPA